MKIVLAIIILVIFSQVQAAPRTVFVQLFEWPWDDIARECEQNLGPNGFAAVQVSPPQEHLSNGKNNWWERYQVVNYNLYSRSGNEDQFINMVKRCNAAHVDVYVDAVINHMTGVDNGQSIAGTPFTHFQYDNLYNIEDFHHCGKNGNDDIKNFEDLYELQNCQLVGLADLKTESKSVQDKIAAYLNKLISYGVKGFRIDAAKHIPAKDLSSIFSRLSRQVYIVQELIAEVGRGPININDYTRNGDVTAYGYPFYVGSAFKNKRFDTLASLKNSMPDSDDSVVFIDNHDLQRAADRSMLISSVYDKDIFDLAQIFMLTYPFGYPQLYSSYRFRNYDDGPPVGKNLMTLPVLDAKGGCQLPFLCEHRRSYISALVNFRNKTDKNFFVTNWWTNGKDQLAFSRGNSGFVVINNSERNLTQTFQTSLPSGHYCNLVDNCSTKVHVDENGLAPVSIARMSAIVIAP